MNKGLVKGAVIDVWENEPHISQELLDKVFIGTPHIAGYSADGKANATRMVLEAFAVSSINRLIFILPSPTIRIKPCRRTRM